MKDKVFVVIRRSELHDKGDSADVVGVFKTFSDAFTAMEKDYFDYKPKNEYCEYWNDPDPQENECSYCDCDDDFREWSITETEVK